MTNPTFDAADATWTTKTASPRVQSDGRTYSAPQGWAYDNRDRFAWMEPAKGAAHIARPRTNYTECGRYLRRWDTHWSKVPGPKSAADICQQCADRGWRDAPEIIRTESPL